MRTGVDKWIKLSSIFPINFFSWGLTLHPATCPPPGEGGDISYNSIFIMDRVELKGSHSRRPAACCNAPPWRRGIPWARRCASGNPGAALRASSSSPTSPAAPGPFAVPPSGARPAAKRFVVQERISPCAPSVLVTTTTKTTDGITTTATSDGSVGTADSSRHDRVRRRR